MTQILHISVPELTAQLRGVRDVQQLIFVHTAFIEVCTIDFVRIMISLPSQSVMQRCLLNRRSEAVMSIISSVFNVTLRCQALIRKRDAASLAAALRSRAEFHSHVGFLYLVLTKLVKRGCAFTRRARHDEPSHALSYNLHLEDILLRLDFRSFPPQHLSWCVFK
jgi:hypothetical protein